MALKATFNPFTGKIQWVSEETSFVTIQTDAGTSPVADSPTDTLTLTSSSGLVIITGNETTDTINFDINGADGTVTVVTDIQDNAGTIEKKTRDLTYDNGVLTTIGAESGWTAI